MNLKDAKYIYMIGIGGIGMSALARIFKAQGKQVSGSDLKDSQITAELKSLGVKIFTGHQKENLASKPDLVIYSQDVSSDSLGAVELNEAKKFNIPALTYAKALGLLMEGHFGIGVTGTNGKSTTSAILGLILEKAGLDPTVVLGTQISPKNASGKFKANARLGAGDYFVAEVDEYHRKMLETKPKMIVITNIAEDHLDYYKDLEDIKNAFAEYINSLGEDGILIYNADDHNTVEVCRNAACHKFTFGIHHYSDLQAQNVVAGSGFQKFDLYLKNEPIGAFELKVPGKFNISNALGACLAAFKLGVDKKHAGQVLSEFAGTWRRFEQVGSIGGKIIISDYGHHPAGIAATLEGAAEFYPDKKILLVFQPHHRNRTKKLFEDFVEALSKASEVIVPEIFDVAGREHGEEISSKMIVDELKAKGSAAEFTKDLDETENMIKKKLDSYDVVLLMGAGDIDLLARRLVNES
ncbi:MAG TPA: UDP-N-acetylmuramate--L-alanine ligase [Patescibacteria group bacterium]|jgi:UDP-N-acetylmuramate--alanine ligase|nr:UDP-N-acetylmuramate--L-alanine ligase [Patescibacteria group bacterium]